MSDDGKSWDLGDLEKEIDAAVDRLFVEEGTFDDYAIETAPKPEPVERQDVVREEQEVALPESIPLTKPPVGPPVLREKLDEVEAQLLTLEWDITPKQMTRAMNLLQDLRGNLPKGGTLELIVVKIRQILNHLFLDDTKLTPDVLKFLLKLWKAVKRISDPRFAHGVDEKGVLKELSDKLVELGFEGIPSGREAVRESAAVSTPTPATPKRTAAKPVEKKPVRPPVELSLAERVKELELRLDMEKKRLREMEEELRSCRLELGGAPDRGSAKAGRAGEEENEIVDLDERLSLDNAWEEGAPAAEPSDEALAMDVSLYEASGAMFGIPADRIAKTFEVKKWVADFFLKNGKVKMKEREVPLFDFSRVFDLEPSEKTSRLVVLFSANSGETMAVLADGDLGREKIEYARVADKPSALGVGISQGREVVILDVNRVAE